jgi:hypothetical protein
MPSVADLDKWKLWIGSIRADGLQRTNLALLIEEESVNPFVLDQTHFRFKDDLCLVYYCLQLKPGIESQEPDLLLGSCIDGEVLIRQMSKLAPFSQSKGYTRAPVSQKWLEEAVTFRAAIRQDQSTSGEYSRFHRGLDVLFTGLREKAQERLHQLVRSLEALILPRTGKTEADFVHRCQTFAVSSAATATILREIFKMRSDAEHLQDWNRAVAAYPVNTGKVPEVILVGGIARDVVGVEVSQEVIHFDRTRRKMLREPEIDASASVHGEAVIISRTGHGASGFGIQDRRICVGMVRANQHLAERLHDARMLLDLGSERVNEDISARGACVAQLVLKLVPQPGALRISHKVGLDAPIVSEVDVKLATTAEYVEACNWREIGMYIDERKAHRNFKFRNIVVRRRIVLRGVLTERHKRSQHQDR